jgi:hypothetical protein
MTPNVTMGGGGLKSVMYYLNGPLKHIEKIPLVENTFLEMNFRVSAAILGTF